MPNAEMIFHVKNMAMSVREKSQLPEAVRRTFPLLCQTNNTVYLLSTCDVQVYTYVYSDMYDKALYNERFNNDSLEQNCECCRMLTQTSATYYQAKTGSGNHLLDMRKRTLAIPSLLLLYELHPDFHSFILQWNLSVTTTSIIKCITCDLINNVVQWWLKVPTYSC